MRFMKSPGLAKFFFLLIVIVPATVWGQSSHVVSEWQTLHPTGEEFSINMPKNSLFEADTMPYHKFQINTRLYLWTAPNSPVFAVVSLSGIKSNPALYTEMERMNSYVDAFKKFLAPRLKGKDAITKLTLVSDKKVNGHAGRLYQISIGDLSGTAEVFSTRKRFYGVAFLNNKKAESLQDQFLSSFELPQNVVEVPPTSVATQNRKPTGEIPSESAIEQKPATKTDAKVAPGPDESNDVDKQSKAAEQKPDLREKDKKPISGGVLNGKALSLPKPEYPAIARAATASGTVTVQVMIDEYGTVIAANAVSGHPLLQASAVAAALQARFSPTFLMGEPVKVSGVLIYNFSPQQ